MGATGSAMMFRRICSGTGSVSHGGQMLGAFGQPQFIRFILAR